MRLLPSIASAVLLAVAVPSFGLTHAHHAPAARSNANIRHTAVKLKHGSRASVRHETPGMDSERATAIQSALIQHGYLSGEPTGTWDSESASAMQKLQGDNGWQTKITPDSRALIKLGLGPQQVTDLTPSTR
ncbi:MAG TPA: peptidoglycan-binding protein [Acidobacteriaceae bacterium]|jgi:hypothetical protein|nr:peptidoglycan-binding protein [Acidobacteriaceae bacterium]